ncbi:MAG: hypothetical protein KF893_03955 [Caldilineaceae bacterium]|nr:hypothetical protein [Caldilineaceae bacterium]
MNRIRTQRKERITTMRSPGTAAVLSFFLPGVGQIYNGRFLWAIFWFIVTPGLWIGSGGFLGWVCHLLSAFQAYSQAKRR